MDPLLQFTAAVVIDIICGGALSALLQQDEPYNQLINDIYHLTYFFIVLLLSLTVTNKLLYWSLFIGMVEDTLFYLFINQFQWIIQFLTGHRYRLPPCGIPCQFGGWPAWVARRFGWDFKIPLRYVLMINGLTIWLVSYL